MRVFSSHGATRPQFDFAHTRESRILGSRDAKTEDGNQPTNACLFPELGHLSDGCWIGLTLARLTILSLRLSLPAKCTTRDYHPTIITTLDYSTVTQAYASTLSELLCATHEGVILHKFLKQGLAGSEGRVPLFRGTGVHLPRVGRSFSQGRVRLIRQRTPLFRGTATPLSEGRLPYSERRVPHNRGSGTPFSG